ncbi:MAG: sigma-70 family RNA polymerase sigma factor [Bacteroidia bacterium]
MGETSPDNRLKHLVDDCRKGKLDSQKELYKQFYGYAMGICLRYSQNREEAKEIVNDGFLKIFAHIRDQREERSFKAWLRKIMIHASIDYFRRNEKYYGQSEISPFIKDLSVTDGNAALSEQEILRLVQLLPPAYRMVFNLYAIEGYKHHEIAEMTGTTVGTSKSNLAKARLRLKEMLYTIDRDRFEKYG